MAGSGTVRPDDPRLHTHLGFVCDYRAASSGGSVLDVSRELVRHREVLAEFAKARMRAQLHARCGTVFDRDLATGEWEVRGVPTTLRDLWPGSVPETAGNDGGVSSLR
jgi:hypothetical protein